MVADTQNGSAGERKPEHPERVKNALEWYLSHLEQDQRDLNQRWNVLAANKEPSKSGQKPMEYVRSKLITARNRGESDPSKNRPIDWHPFILEYCRTLKCDHCAVDRLFQRLLWGDLLDRRGTRADFKVAIEQLQKAIDIAEKQWLAGDTLIHKPRKGADSCADTRRNSMPKSPDVIELIHFISSVKPKRGEEAETARRFCRNNGLALQTAPNLLRQARRYKHLWKTPQLR